MMTAGERERAEVCVFARPGCVCTRAWQVGTVKCLDKHELADVLPQFLCLASLPRFSSRILHRKGATCARGGVLKFVQVVNHDTTVHAVHASTVAFSP